MVEAETIKNRKELARFAQLITQLARAPISGCRRRCREAMRRDVRATERQLDCKFPPRTLCGRRHGRKPAQRIAEPDECFGQDRT